MLEGDDFAGTQAQAFLGDNPLFPSAHGTTPTEALQKLDAKLQILYRFEPRASVSKWEAVPLFDLRAEYDAAPGETVSTYQVVLSDVVQDLRTGSLHFYDDAMAASNARYKRDLHALVNFKYESAFAQLK
jgi:hypothetical protein